MSFLYPIVVGCTASVYFFEGINMLQHQEHNEMQEGGGGRDSESYKMSWK